MNSLSGYIKDVEVDGALSLVTLKLKDEILLYAIVIDSPKTSSYLAENNPIQVHFKETEVILAKENKGALSIENSIKGSIVEIKIEPLLTEITLNTSVGNVIAIISSKSQRKLDLKKDDIVWAMIKTNEILLSEK